MDRRLSKPKALDAVEVVKENRVLYFRNSTLTHLHTSLSANVGATGPTGPSISYVGGNDASYNALATVIGISATRMKEYVFNVTDPSNIFLFNYNIVLSSGIYTSQITTTLGIASGVGALAASSINVYTGTTPVALTGANTDAYIAGSNGTVVSGNACNIVGQGTITG